MKHENIVEQLWLGEVQAQNLDDMSPLSRMLCCLMDRPVIGLTTTSNMQPPVALLESEELLPGTTFADILDEEMGLDVEPDTLIVIEPEEFASAPSYIAKELGNILGAMLIDLVADTMSVAESRQAGSLLTASLKNSDQFLSGDKDTDSPWSNANSSRECRAARLA